MPAESRQPQVLSASAEHAVGVRFHPGLRRDRLGDSPKGKTVALLGLTFKPNTDNMRDASAIAIAQALTDEGVSVRAYDPEGMAPAREMMPDLTSCGDANDAAEGADAVVIVTEWDAFRARSRQAQADHGRAVLVDLRNVYRRDEVEGAGFSYTAVGR